MEQVPAENEAAIKAQLDLMKVTVNEYKAKS